MDIDDAPNTNLGPPGVRITAPTAYPDYDVVLRTSDRHRQLPQPPIPHPLAEPVAKPGFELSRVKQISSKFFLDKKSHVINKKWSKQMHLSHFTE
jgi:hypothetical protein